MSDRFSRRESASADNTASSWLDAVSCFGENHLRALADAVRCSGRPHLPQLRPARPTDLGVPHRMHLANCSFLRSREHLRAHRRVRMSLLLFVDLRQGKHPLVSAGAFRRLHFRKVQERPPGDRPSITGQFAPPLVRQTCPDRPSQRGPDHRTSVSDRRMTREKLTDNAAES